MTRASQAVSKMPEALPRATADPYKFGMPDRAKDSVESEAGLRQLLTEMRSELTRFMLAREGDPAEVEDCLQDMYVRLSSIRTGPVSNPRSYLYQMANNLLHDRRRRRLRRSDRDDFWARNHFGHDLERDPEPSPEQVTIDRDELRRVERILASMPPRTAEVLKRFRVEGQTQKSIANSMELSLSAVEKHLQRAYKLLMRVRSELDADLAFPEEEADDVSFS